MERSGERPRGVWRRLRAYLTRGLRLLDAAQVESLGGSHLALARPADDGSAEEPSPYYPGNWTAPYESLFAPLHPWLCEQWAIQATAQTMMGGGRQGNHELFGVAPHRGAAMMVSALAHEPPDWRLPAVALAAGLDAIGGASSNALPCHLALQRDQPHECQAPSLLQRALWQSHRALRQRALQQPGRHALCAGAVLHVCCDRAWFAQLGGLCLYRWRRGVLQPLDSPAEAEPRPLPHPTQRTLMGGRETRYLGFRELPPLQISDVSLREGDIFAMASRGLHETVPRHAIEQAIGEHPDALEAACLRLTDIAWSSRHQSGDISLLLVHITHDLRRLRRQEAQRWHARLEQGLF